MNKVYSEGDIKMKNNMFVLGGDKRQLYLAKSLKDKGYNVEIFGFSNVKNDFFIPKSLCDGMKKNDIIILPMPVTRNNVVLNTPLNEFTIALEEICDNITENHFILGGMINKRFFYKTDNIYDYSESEELMVKNAMLTAEATIEVIISNTPYSIFNSDILILGYGRIGKLLSDDLKNLGANVTVCMRKEYDFAMCSVKGLNTLSYEVLKDNIKKFRTVINTVPFKILDKKIIDCMREDVFLIDISSKDGGCDFEYLSKKGIKHIHALGLPGKTAPETAGNIISDIIVKQIKKG